MAEYYVSPAGDNGDTGGISDPWFEIEYADDQVSANDTVWLRGGTYSYTGNGQSLDTTSSVNYFAYQDEVPIIDCSGITVGDTGVYISASGTHLRGVTITSMDGNGSDGIGVAVRGDSITVENCVATLCTYAGFNFGSGASNSKCLNCDSHQNGDTDDGEDGDGFHMGAGSGVGNSFEGCRSWDNSDDGFDFIDASSLASLTNCWAWDNGKNFRSHSPFNGDGNGFKLGSNEHRHVCNNCIASGNGQDGSSGDGFDANANPGPLTIINCTADNNDGWNFETSQDAASLLRNNLSYQGTESIHASATEEYNDWNNPPNITVVAGDFVSTNSGELTQARQADGSLPSIDYMRPTPDGQLADNGKNGSYIGALAPAGTVEVTTSPLWRGAIEPTDPLGSGNEYQAWRGAVEKEESEPDAGAIPGGPRALLFAG